MLFKIVTVIDLMISLLTAEVILSQSLRNALAPSPKTVPQALKTKIFDIQLSNLHNGKHILPENTHKLKSENTLQKAAMHLNGRFCFQSRLLSLKMEFKKKETKNVEIVTFIQN